VRFKELKTRPKDQGLPLGFSQFTAQTTARGFAFHSNRQHFLVDACHIAQVVNQNAGGGTEARSGETVPSVQISKINLS